MNKVFVRLLAVIVIIANLLPLCSCERTTEGTQVAISFLNAVSKMKFEQAYRKVHCSCSKSDFVKMYKDFFKTLNISEVEFTSHNEFNSAVISKYEYTLTYKSEICGEIKDDYKITVKKFNGKTLVDWSPSLILPEMDYGDTVVRSRITAKRGDIIAGHTILAENIPVIAVSVDTNNKDKATLAETAEKISEILGMPVDKINKKMEKPDYNGIVLVNEYHPYRITTEQTNALNAIDGVSAKESSYSSTRTYNYGSTLAHTLGYTYSASNEEIEKYNEGRTEEQGLYTETSKVGKSGLELKYEKELRGTDGYRYCLRSSDSVIKRNLYECPPEDGLDIQLTIDYELQQKAEALLANTLFGEATSGVVIVMNPRDGAVEAMASYPTYDLNKFASGITSEEYSALVSEDAHSPLVNRAINGKYIPGSVFKPITAAAALTYDILDDDDEFPGVIENDYWTPVSYGTWVYPAIKRTKVKRRNTPLNMRNAIIHSDNIYFAYAALQMGDDKLEEYFNSLGMNEPLPFELSVSTSQYKSANDPDRNIKSVADSGYGQGTVLVTPLQIASVYCAFANGGDIPVPYIVKGLYSENENGYDAVETTTPKMWRENAISERICSKLTEMMKDVVSTKYNGTGQALRVKNCVVAGKTGTAEIDKTHEHAWFIGYRTGVSKADERLVLVVIDIPANKSEYSELKFDIARELLEIEKD